MKDKKDYDQLKGGFYGYVVIPSHLRAILSRRNPANTKGKENENKNKKWRNIYGHCD